MSSGCWPLDSSQAQLGSLPVGPDIRCSSLHPDGAGHVDPGLGSGLVVGGVGSSLAAAGGEGSSQAGRRQGSSATGRWTAFYQALPI